MMRMRGFVKNAVELYDVFNIKADQHFIRDPGFLHSSFTIAYSPLTFPTFAILQNTGQLKSFYMEPENKKSFIARNIEWIALIIVILAGLIAIWQFFYPDLFSS